MSSLFAGLISPPEFSPGRQSSQTTRTKVEMRNRMVSGKAEMVMAMKTRGMRIRGVVKKPRRDPRKDQTLFPSLRRMNLPLANLEKRNLSNKLTKTSYFMFGHPTTATIYLFSGLPSRSEANLAIKMSLGIK